MLGPVAFNLWMLWGLWNKIFEIDIIELYLGCLCAPSVFLSESFNWTGVAALQKSFL